VRKETGETRPTGTAKVEDAPVYRKDLQGASFFRDLHSAKRGDWNAQDRLRRNNEQTGFESRALGNTGGAGGSGGEFAPPAWLVDEFIALARPGRVFANLANNVPLPDGVSSINLPKILTGTTTAIQTTQNTALSQTDMTTGSVAATITTIGGKQVVAQQLLDQSAIPFDRIIMQDLAADYAKQLDLQFISGSGSSGQLRGVMNGSSVGATAYTNASPAVSGANSLYSNLAKAISTIEAARYLPPTAIVMHPRRWAYLLAAVDSASRPLITLEGPAYNALANAGALDAQGPVGNMLGLPVYTDPNIATNLGAGTNQDPVFVLRREDLYLYESSLRMQSFDATYADSAGVLFRAFAYSAAIPDRYGPSVNVVNGTGLVTPTF
jgi:HK97 family phage major capsid protein